MYIDISDDLLEFIEAKENMKGFFEDICKMSEKYLFPLKDSFIWICENNHSECFNFKGEQYQIFRDAFVNVPDFEITFIYSYNKGEEFYHVCLNCELAEL